uniref:Small nuclear ribonucleoprotein G n=1 Tax=Salarias fasciatus TaxID=181472 RepID=A0A672I618_SALFA
MSKAHPPELKKETMYPNGGLQDSLFISLLCPPVKLNGGRHVQGILRGFDPFMNLVVDDCLEMGPGGQQNTIGMVVIRGNSIIMLEALERV